LVGASHFGPNLETRKGATGTPLEVSQIYRIRAAKSIAMRCRKFLKWLYLRIQFWTEREVTYKVRQEWPKWQRQLRPWRAVAAVAGKVLGNPKTARFSCLQLPEGSSPELLVAVFKKMLMMPPAARSP